MEAKHRPTLQMMAPKRRSHSWVLLVAIFGWFVRGAVISGPLRRMLAKRATARMASRRSLG